MSRTTRIRSSLHIRRSRSRALLAAGATVLAVAAIGSSSAQAVPGGGTFELDRNAVRDASASPPYDWANLQSECSTSACPTGIVAATGVVGDLPTGTGADSTYFTGGGSKDNRDVDQWGNGGNGSPDKNELTNAYAAASRDSAGHLVIYTGADRYDNSGAAEMGFWLFKGIVRTGSGANAGKFVDDNGAAAKHSVGDVLILSDFTQGGAIGEIIIYKWVGTGGDSGGGTLQQVAKSTTADCTLSGVGDDYCATINQDTTPDAPWPYSFKGLGSVSKFQPRTFLEGGVNVGNLGLGECFGSYLAETRTAPEIKGAELKDYALGDFPVCSPSTTMVAGSGTPPLPAMTASPDPAATGQSVTFTAYERNDGTDPLNPPTAGNTGSFVQSADCSPWTNTAGDSTTTGTVGVLDPGETWTFTCSKSYSTSGSKTVTVVGHGLDPRFSNKDVTTCPAADTTKICDAQETAQVSVTVINPSTALSFTGSTPTVRIVHSGGAVALTFTEANDATGAGNVLSSPGANRDAFMTANNGCSPAYVSGDSTTTGTSGKLDPGETWTFTCTVNPTADVTVEARGHGIDALGRDVTYCGTGESTTGKFCDADEVATASVNVINPSTALSGSGSALVTLTWFELNDSPQTDETLSNVSVTANNGCTPTQVFKSGSTTINFGDTDGDGLLDKTESWKFSCQITVGPATSTTVTAVGHGTDTAGTEVTACATPDATKVCDADETSSVTVTVS